MSLTRLLPLERALSDPHQLLHLVRQIEYWVCSTYVIQAHGPAR